MFDLNGAYQLAGADKQLIEAALVLGEWLDCQPEVSESQRSAIREVLNCLRVLPRAARLDFVGCFGFLYVLDDPEWCGAHCGSWCVSFTRGVFEIFSCGNEDLGEFGWEVLPGKTPFHEGNFADWISQVQAARSLSVPECSFVIEASATLVPD